MRNASFLLLLLLLAASPAAAQIEMDTTGVVGIGAPPRAGVALAVAADSGLAAHFAGDVEVAGRLLLSDAPGMPVDLAALLDGLLAALREQQSEIEALRARVAALEASD